VVFLSETVDSGAATFLQYPGDRDGPNDTQWKQRKETDRGLYANKKGERTERVLYFAWRSQPFLFGVTSVHI
jgi:hypothetical protein